VPQSLESVREQLLRAGIAPREANRYVSELREHLVDLTERERRAGLDGNAAAERARDLLGSEAQLVQAMIDKTPRSLAARAPWAVFTLLPVLVLLVAIAAIDLSMMRLLAPVQATWRGGAPGTYGGIAMAVSFATNYLLGALFVAGCVAIALRQRLSSPWLWVGVGMIAVLSGLLGFHINIFPLVGGHSLGTTFSTVPVVFVDGRVSAAATLSVVAARAAVLFIIAAIAFRFLRTRLTSHAAS
jgi:hypothetical protein